jgi:hypothetical protein
VIRGVKSCRASVYRNATSRRIIIDRAGFEEALSKSECPTDVALQYDCNRTTVYHTLKRFGLKPPLQWQANAVSAFNAAKPIIPQIIIERELDRAWSASLFGGEGCIAANYNERLDRTYLVTVLRMSDKEWVDHFSRLVGFSASGERRKGEYKTQWDRTLVGKRALRFLVEILPYLYGGKKAEALRAIEFFSPSGHRRGRHSSLKIWPSSEFPLRKRPLHSEPNKGRPRNIPPAE